jgi:ABC-2 type transport system permease protein/lipopolysaccharide transport system permease protein
VGGFSFVVALGDIDVQPAAELRYRHRLTLPTAARRLWRSRELVITLAERDVRARYKQTFLGFAWAFVQPLSLMLVFTFLARRAGSHIAALEASKVPYPLFAYTGLLVWGFFSASVLGGGLSLLANTSLLNKVRCPREAFPIASMAVATMDAVIASILLIVMFAFTGFWPKATSYYVLPLLVVLVVFTLAVTLAIASTVVYVRDLRSVLPLGLQLGLFVTPLMYDMDSIPAAFRLPYSAINPLGPVIDGVRRAVLFGQAPHWSQVGVAALSASVMLGLAWLLFNKLEMGMADVL